MLKTDDQDTGKAPNRDRAERQPDPARPEGGRDGSEARGPSQDRQPDRKTAEADPQRGQADRPQTRTKGLLRRHPVAATFAAILLLAILAAGYLYWDYSRHFESTDDAFVDSRQFAVAPKVSGYITLVAVTDNQHVGAGDLIAKIDDRDYRIALEQADAQVAVAAAGVQNVEAQLAAQQEQIREAQAQVAQAEAALRFAEQEAARYRDLAQRGAGTVQQAQQSASNLQQQQANLVRAQAAVAAAQQQIDSLKAQRASAAASLAQAKAQHDQAQLNLSYTTITAAQTGRIVRLTAAVGQYVQTATSLAMFVPDEIWVTANFKETQLTDMRPGQAATMRIDAYPGRTIRGEVASIQPGSGTAFSLLPAENATGNYVKIVQRVPVKLVMDDRPADVALGPGMSVVPSVRVRPEPSLYERLTGRT